jgi:acyl carrier protein
MDILSDSELEADLELDSLALIRTSIAIEEQLRVAVPAGESPVSEMRTVRDLVDFVHGRLRGQEVHQ